MDTWAVIVWVRTQEGWRKARGFVSNYGLAQLLQDGRCNVLFSPVAKSAYETLQAGLEGGELSFWDEGAVRCDPECWISADVQAEFDKRYPTMGPMWMLYRDGLLRAVPA